MDKLTPAQLQAYLGLTPKQFAEMDDETKKTLMEVKVEDAKESSKDKDAAVNTTSWRYLLRPYQWTGYRQAGIHLAAGFGNPEIQHRAAAHRQPEGHAGGAALFRAAGVGRGAFMFRN